MSTYFPLRMKDIVVIACMALLSGCAGRSLLGPDLTRLSIADLTAASALADVGKDPAAMQCYRFLLAEARPPAPLTTTPAGPVSTLQIVRNNLHGPSAQSDSLLYRWNLACAAFNREVELDLAKGAMMGAGIASGAGAAGSLGTAIDAIKAVLPLLGIGTP